MKKITVLVALTLLCNNDSNAQSLAVNTDGSTAHGSALLDVKSTTRGLLIPRMTKTEKNAIGSPATGLLIFQTAPDSVGFHYYNGSSWAWLANSVAPEEWLITGNSNATASSYLGTNNGTDLRFAANSFEFGRISSNSGFWGYGEINPQYNMDIALGTAAVNPCTRNGIRLKPPGFSNGCDNGFFMGLDNNLSIADASIWNYGNNLSGAQNLKLGLNNTEIVRFTTAAFQGLGETDPQYNLDMRLGIAAVFPCIRNGIRLNTPANSNACERGLFVGYDNNTVLSTASFWNFGDGSSFPPGYSLRFGLGGDFTLGEKMRITGDGVGIGSTSPIAKLHIIDRTGALLPGVMVTNTSLPSSSNGFYTGLKDNGIGNTGRVWNYQNADIEFGANDILRMIIASSGEVGIATSLPPTSTLQVDGTLAVGVSSNITGGTIGSPTVISTQKSFLSLSPSGGDHYQLPNPLNCAGRIYYIRNTDNTVAAQLGSVAGLICPGSGACLAPGAYYSMAGAASGKTVVAISDGTNWTVGKID
ncbi:MAG TPA: hypothetical protein PK133_07655 [Ferruginibacter sp.]|nr:hypothetical protein [Ferruginibacter sp.]